jgi:hypothetical protein
MRLVGVLAAGLVGGGDTRIQAVARTLATAARSLQRRLAAAGCSYQQLLNLARKDAAERCLSDSPLSNYIARSFARLSAREDALASLSDVVHHGFFCYPAFVTDPWLDGIRHLQPFRELLETAQSRHESAREAFRGAGGGQLR